MSRIEEKIYRYHVQAAIVVHKLKIEATSSTPLEWKGVKHDAESRSPRLTPEPDQNNKNREPSITPRPQSWQLPCMFPIAARTSLSQP